MNRTSFIDPDSGRNQPLSAGRLGKAFPAAKIVAGLGSSILFHIWRGGGSKPTAGCTTMAESKPRELIAWLDPGRQPISALLPKAEYDPPALAVEASLIRDGRSPSKAFRYLDEKTTPVRIVLNARSQNQTKKEVCREISGTSGSCG